MSKRIILYTRASLRFPKVKERLLFLSGNGMCIHALAGRIPPRFLNFVDFFVYDPDYGRDKRIAEMNPNARAVSVLEFLSGQVRCVKKQPKKSDGQDKKNDSRRGKKAARA